MEGICNGIWDSYEEFKRIYDKTEAQASAESVKNRIEMKIQILSLNNAENSTKPCKCHSETDVKLAQPDDKVSSEIIQKMPLLQETLNWNSINLICESLNWNQNDDRNHFFHAWL